ncbi:MAG: sulfite exporter TauE/SafE family protein [Pseudomonadota bacterium]
MLSPEIIVLVLATFFVGGLVKGSLGLGLPVVVLASLALVMPLRDALAIFLIPGVLTNIWQASDGPFFRPLLARLWPFLLAAAIGIGAGVTIMAGVRSEVMAVLLGVLLIAYSAYALSAPRLPAPGPREGWMAPLAGGSGGVLCGMTGIFIVPGILYLEALRLPRDQFVQALGITFITLTVSLSAAMTSNALVTREHAILSAMGLVPVFAGLAIGKRLRGRLSEGGFRRIFFIALIVVGAYMIIRSL